MAANNPWWSNILPDIGNAINPPPTVAPIPQGDVVQSKPTAPIPQSNMVDPPVVPPSPIQGQLAFGQDMAKKMGGDPQHYQKLYQQAVQNPGFSGNYYGYKPLSTPTPSPTPTPTPTSTPMLTPGHISYKGGVITIPPKPINDIIQKYFGKDAQDAAAVASTENATFNPKIADNINTDGSIDRGIFQINSNTFNGLMKRRPDLMRGAGINSFDDMYDPEKNTAVAKMVHDEGGWGRWFGWQNRGLNLPK